MAIRGRAAEKAVGLACVHYLRAGKADIRKQATGMRKVGGGYRFTTKSPIDFRGTLAGGKSICIEVKEHSGVSFPLNESTLSAKQRDALDAAVSMGGEVWLLVDLPDLSESYIVAWSEVQAFIRAPYRHSLSLQWMRAYGFICKASGRNTADFRIWVLDYSEHAGKAGAYLAEAADRARSHLVDLEKPIEGAQTREHLTADERRARVVAATEKYLKKNAKKGWAQ